MNNDRIFYSHQAEVQATRRMLMLAVLWLLVGLGVGAGMALLLAPASGKKVRRNLVKSMEESLSSGHDAIEPVVKRLEKEVGELRQTVESGIAKLK